MSQIPVDKMAAVWFDRVWNQSDTSAIDEMFAQNGVAHGVGEDIKGPAEFRAFHAAFTSAFTGMHVDIVDQLVMGNRVAARVSMEMTHGASKRKVVLNGMVLLDVENGKFVEAWNYFDFADFLAQMGLIPGDALAQAIAGTLKAHTQV